MQNITDKLMQAVAEADYINAIDPAKPDGSAKTYANRAQAEKAALQSGGAVWQSPQSRVFFVRMEGNE